MMFCKNCGASIDNYATHCPQCGAPTGAAAGPDYGAPVTPPPVGYGMPPAPPVPPAPRAARSRLIAGILALLFGTFGLHNFYLGNKGKAIGQVVLSTVGAFCGVGPVIALIWAWVEGLDLLTGKTTVDGEGYPLVYPL